MAFGNLGSHGDLSAKLVRADGKEIQHPFLGSLFARLEKNIDEAIHDVSSFFQTELIALHLDANGKVVDHTATHVVLPGGAVHLGSGLVTNAGVNMMVDNGINNRFGQTLSNLQYHAIGSGSTAAAATDYYLQTPNGTTNLVSSTNGYMTATNTVVAPNQWKSVATFSANGAVTVNEWILTMSNAANFSGTATSTASTSLTNTGASFTTSGNGLAGWTIEANSSAINTPTTTVMGLVTSNTATVLTVGQGWWTLANASASTPSGTTAYVVYPTAFDRKQFSTITMANGDTLQTTYTNTINSGG